MAMTRKTHYASSSRVFSSLAAWTAATTLVVASAFVHHHRCGTNTMNPPRLVRRATVEFTLEDQPIGGPLAPLGNYVLVKVASTSETTAGGLFLSEQAKEKPTEGVVIAAGPGRTHPDTGVLMPVPVDVGQRVLYGKYDGTAVKYCGEDHQLIRDDDILLAWAGETLTLESATPVRDRILLSVEKQEEMTKSGIALAPGVAEQQKTSVGKVIKFGEGRLTSAGTMMPMPVVVGDSVKYRDYAGSEIKIGGVEYVVCRMIDCLAKWSEE